MKKILIGCGILVLLVLVAFGVMAFVFADDFKAMGQEMISSATTMVELEDQHPFTEPASADEFNSDRFLTSLSVRSEIMSNMAVLGERFERLESEELGFFDKIKEGMAAASDASTGLYKGVGDALSDNGMAPSEFVYHTKVLWASLKSIDAGLGDTSLEAYRNVFTKANTETATQLKFQPGTPESLEAFSANIKPDIVEEAVAALGNNVGLLEQGLPAEGAVDMVRAIDIITMGLPKWLNDMKPAVEQQLQLK